MADPCLIECVGIVYVDPSCSNNRESVDWLNRHYHKLANFLQDSILNSVL